MKSYSNPGLLHVQALFIDNTDSHAQMGAHVRVTQHPLLGLPVAPFVLERADITTDNFKILQLREEALFRDRKKNALVPPFDLRPEDEITIILPTGSDKLAIWAQIDIEPEGRRKPRATAYLCSAGKENVLLGQRFDLPLAFSGTGIVRMVLRGQGKVTGVRWLNALDEQDLLKYRTVDVLNLPHKGGGHYAMLNDWKVLCQRRRDEQAPKRYPLQDTDGAPSRSVAPVFNASLENQRVGVFFEELAPPLDQLLDHYPASQSEQVIVRELTHDDGSNIAKDGSGEIRIGSLGLFLQGQTDPGMASFCGYKTLDRDNNENPGHRLSIYRLTSFFRDPDRAVLAAARKRGEAFFDLINTARQTHDLLKPQVVHDLWQKMAAPYLEPLGIHAEFDSKPGNCLAISGVAVADHFATLRSPHLVSLDTPEHKHWLPTEDNFTPLRVTETGVRGLVAGAAICATRRQPHNADQWFPQNSEIRSQQDRWRALILPNLPQAGGFAAPIPPAGLPDAFLSDPATGESRFRMYVAQMDRFGRFSEWRSVLGAAGRRPLPPRPIVRGSYRQPEIISGGHQGRVTVFVPLPDKSALAPGSYPLSHAHLIVKVEGVVFITPIDMPVTGAISIHPDTPTDPQDPAIPPDEEQWAVQTQFDGPILATMASKRLELTAIWVDEAGQESAWSEPLFLKMTDPYPPEQTPVIDKLLYAARPDATGKAWVERSWPVAGDLVTFAVYYTDENRLRDHLAELGTGDSLVLLEQLQNASNPAERATLLRGNQALFPDFLFERLKDVLEEADKTGRVGFRHALSKSLRVLSGYKVVAEAAATSARPSLERVDTVFYAVPNSDPPARPVITAHQQENGGAERLVDLTITHRPVATPAKTALIRRTRSGVIDPIRNPVIGTATFSDVDDATGLQTALFQDNGAALIAPDARFSPFVNYAWLAEAQGAPEPGSGSTSESEVAGLWSQPSVAVSLDVVPEQPPAPATFEEHSGMHQPDGVVGLALTFSYPANLVPTHLGPWMITVERRLPNQAIERIIEQEGEAGERFTVSADPDDPAFLTPLGTLFRLYITDPLGRKSGPVEYIV